MNVTHDQMVIILKDHSAIPTEQTGYTNVGNNQFVWTSNGPSFYDEAGKREHYSLQEILTYLGY